MGLKSHIISRIEAVIDLAFGPKNGGGVDTPIVTPEQICIVKTSSDGSKEIRESGTRKR